MIRSVSLSYTSQFIALFTQIISIRLLLDYFGQSGFGSISYLLGIIATVGIFEIGISQTLMRANAEKNSNIVFLNNLAYIYFICLTFLVICVYFVNSRFFSDSQENYLDYFFLSIFIVKVFSIFYKSLSFGSGKYDQINLFNLIISILRNIIMPLICIFFGLSLVSYISMYLLVSTLELFYYLFLSGYKFKRKDSFYVNFSVLRSDLKLFLQVAIIGFTWTYSQNIERLIVMYFKNNQDLIIVTLALTILAAMYYVNTSITNIFNVRLMNTLSKNEIQFKKYFLSLSKFRIFIFSSMTLTLFSFTDEILTIWLHDYPDIGTLSNILKILIVGVFLILISSVSFQYQFIRGEISLQLKTAIVYMILQTTLGAYLYSSTGLLGMSLSFLVLNGLFSIFLISFIFIKKEPKVLFYLLSSVVFCLLVFFIVTKLTSNIYISFIFIVSILILYMTLNPLKELKNVN
mgnify:CR=1 FL=1|tara:strand:- start:1011 stop:2393 length:1383 start_codon:yes stop_codon:yes gene_type:complete